jgi:hypothetical protein
MNNPTMEGKGTTSYFKNETNPQHPLKLRFREEHDLQTH